MGVGHVWQFSSVLQLPRRKVRRCDGMKRAKALWQSSHREAGSVILPLKVLYGLYGYIDRIQQKGKKDAGTVSSPGLKRLAPSKACLLECELAFGGLRHHVRGSATLLDKWHGEILRPLGGQEEPCWAQPSRHVTETVLQPSDQPGCISSNGPIWGLGGRISDLRYSHLFTVLSHRILG